MPLHLQTSALNSLMKPLHDRRIVGKQLFVCGLEATFVYLQNRSGHLMSVSEEFNERYSRSETCLSQLAMNFRGLTVALLAVHRPEVGFFWIQMSQKFLPQVAKVKEKVYSENAELV